MLSYDELQEKYKQALEEIESLRKENAKLKAMLGVPASAPFSHKTVPDAGINNRSGAEDKIALFRSLFRGREDVFARRWYSQTTGKSGYQPVCENEWADDLCDKRTYKCSACPNRKLTPLTDKAIYDHLAGKNIYGRDVIGIYPMLADETCRFLAADFDGDNFEKDVSAFRSICREWDIPVSIERSRSGAGAHAWIFFEKPIPAADARKLGSTILTAAMERHGELSFRSYDRLFPNQDTMPTGGFGNLIALPLQGQARKNKNSVFVDKEFLPYPDQWAYLDSVKRISAEQIDSILAKYGKGQELGDLVKEENEKPWEPKKKHILGRFDFPSHLSVILANMLYIPRKELSSCALNAIKRLAAFKNPEFFRAQAMRMPIYDKPRVICCAELTDEYVALPRGCENALREMLENVGVDYEIEDKTGRGSAIPVSFVGELREEQLPAAAALIGNDTGVLSATTAFGKTVIASYLISQRKISTLILVHTGALLTQWKKSLEEFLQFDIVPPEKPKGRGRRTPWSPIGLLGAQKDSLHGIVDVAMIQSALSEGETKDFVKNYGMVIVDECHHVSAVNFEKVLKNVNAKYVYGLTATPTRQDGHHPIIFMQCGPIRYRVDPKEIADKRPFEHYLIPRFTSFRTVKNQTITALYKELADNRSRNELIIEDVVAAIKENHTPIILTERREHVEALKQLLSGKCKNIITLVGTASQKERRDTTEQLASIPDSDELAIIATGKYVGEGFDFPRLDSLFLALPIAWKGKVAQYVGRLHRNFEGKAEVRVYDYVDIHVPVLERMYQKRVKSYAAIGYKAKVSTIKISSPDLIYDGKSFYPVFSNDVSCAKSEILIVSPFMKKNRLAQMVKLLTPVMLNGVSAVVVTRPPDDFKESEHGTVKENADFLINCGIKVLFKSEFRQKFTVIDQKIVWYGSVNFLSFGTHEESIMRFESPDIAGQLMDTVL